MHSQGESLPSRPDLARRVHLGVLAILQTIMAAELAWLVIRENWLPALLVLALMTSFALPLFFRRFPVEIPSEIHLLAILFIFATLFLGEMHDYYERLWWWDLVLHGTAGLLTGLFGILAVYMLNENASVDLHMRPSFVALFGFFFALAIGSVWEIFEFAMDRGFGLNMQKPTPGDPSGLTDTMQDLIVNAIGALFVSLAGWIYIRRTRRAVVDSWIRRFVERNPQIFGE